MTCPPDPSVPSDTPLRVPRAPAGWYPDPAGPPGLRWWDGATWTAHTSHPAAQEPTARAAASFVVTGSGAVELAGWWRRFLGYLLDGLIIGVPSFLLTLAVGAVQFARQPDGTERVVTTGDAGEILVVGLGVVVGLGYPYLMLRFRSQTVGMMAAGVRAVDRSSGTLLTPPHTAWRVLTLFGLSTLWQELGSVLAFAGGHAGLATALRLLGYAGLILTGLWPTGSPLKQTLQDKVAGTIVVRTR